MLTAVSLFAGVGGFDLAMERNGINVVADVEIDRAARGVLERRFPDSKHFSDVKEVSGEQLRDAGFISDRGVLTGGFPCQDLSVAGARAGLAGRRSGLYWEIVRLIDELSPKWFVLENVPGLLSSNDGGDFGTILGSLVERGYGVAYRILDAQYFGVPQRRRRVFIVGCLGDDGSAPFEVLALAQGVCGDPASSIEAGSEIANSLTTGFGRGGADDNSAQSGHLVAETLHGHPRFNADETMIAHTLTTEYDASEDGTGRGLPLVSQKIASTLTAGVSSKGVSAPRRRQEDDFNLVAFGQTQFGGYSEDEVKTLTETQYKRPEDNVVVSYVKSTRPQTDQDPETWVEGRVSPTLNDFDNASESRSTVLAFATRNSAHVGADENGFDTLRTKGMAAIADKTAVRRLTPIECERLQGFPDGWTDGQKDGARYKQMGNAVAVPVVEWIAARLVDVDRRIND